MCSATKLGVIEALGRRAIAETFSRARVQPVRQAVALGLGQYSLEFKLKAVKLSQLKGVEVQAVANALEIHPFMLSRWRKEVRDGDLFCCIALTNPSEVIIVDGYSENGVDVREYALKTYRDESA